MSRRALILRGFGVLLALALGGAGAWLLVTAHELRWVRIGALAELWGVLVGAFALFGARRRAEPVLIEPAEPEPEPVDEDEVRYDKRMEDILRRELRSALTRELNVLRAQVAALRSDVLERMQPDDAPAVADAIQATQHRLAELSEQHAATTTAADEPEAEDQPATAGDTSDGADEVSGPPPALIGADRSRPFARRRPGRRRR